MDVSVNAVISSIIAFDFLKMSLATCCFQARIRISYGCPELSLLPCTHETLVKPSLGEICLVVDS